MERRVASLAALLVVLSVGGVAFAASSASTAGPLAAVPWPVSTLLVSEVQTGGASASDEFAEIANVGPTAVDLAGLELVYATSTGSTVTRKASWSSSLLLGQGKHLFVANASGIFAGLADATYSGGFASTGGAIVLRPIGGAPIDAVGWGDATNTFVEGAAVAAPAAGSSIERKPGGLAGNTTDTNSNADDWFTQASPNPQGLAAPPVPAPGASPTPMPTSTPVPTGTPSPTTTSEPSVAPSATPATTDPAPSESPVPTASPDASATPAPEPTPTIEPTVMPSPTATPEPTTEPTPIVTAEPTPVPTPEPTPAPTPTSVPTLTPEPTATPSTAVSILAARGQANGTTAQVTGVLTTQLGALESGRKAFLQDDSAGIAIYLDAAIAGGLPAGTIIAVAGVVDDRFAERTLRVNLADIVPLGSGILPVPAAEQAGDILEPVEGLRVLVHGVTVGSSTALADGLGLMVDDGTGQVRVIVGPDALGGLSVPSGTAIVATGPVGQRDSSGTGLAGYRVHATATGEFEILVPPTPSPTDAPTATPAPTAVPTATPAATTAPSTNPTPAPTAAPTPTATPAPTATSVPTPRPSATPGPTPPPVLSIVEARGATIGTVVTVAGVVTAEAGRLGLPPLIAIADGTGGIVVRLPDGVASPARGATVAVKGQLADPYGQLELRPTATDFKVTGQGSLPAPARLVATDLGEATEGRLADLMGTVVAPPSKGTSGDLTIDVVDQAGASFRVLADGSSRILATDLVKGRTYHLTGIVGQRASRKGALDGYRLYLRDRADIVAAASVPSPGASAAATSVSPIATALALADGTAVTVEATVTAGVTLLDSSGRRIVVQDATGAIEIYLPSGSGAPAVGTTIRVSGATGHAWGAPRIAATNATIIVGGSAQSPRTLGRAPAERDEWLLVRISGSVVKVERLGDRWRAEIQLPDGSKAPIQGQAGAGIPSTAIVAGRRITVTGIVKRPYPTASDRRFAVLPRGGGDVALGPAGNGTAATVLGSGPASSAAAGSGQPGIDITPDTDLATLLDHAGQRVRVGGLIARLAGDGFDLDDGTAIARIELVGDMAGLIQHVSEGDAVAATGIVKVVDGTAIVVVDETGTLVRVGSLGQALPIGGTGQPGSSRSDDRAGAPMTADSAGLGSGLAPTSLLAMAAISALSVLATMLRRRLLRRRLRTALIDRLATLRSKVA